MASLHLCNWCGSDCGDKPVHVAASYDARGGNWSRTVNQGDKKPDYPMVCSDCRRALWAGDFDELTVRNAMLDETYSVPMMSLVSTGPPAVTHRTLRPAVNIALAVMTVSLVSIFCLLLAMVL